MHFWIDKRSQTCGFSGRHRVPSSLSAGACRPNVRCSSSIWGGACSVGGGGCSGGGVGGVGVGSCPRPSQSKSMVTPVHRFQSIESAAIAGSSRPTRHAAYPSPARLHRLRSPPFAGVSGPNHGADAHARHETPDRGGGGVVHVADIVDDAPLDASEHRRAGNRLVGAHSSATPDTMHGPHLVYPNYRNRSIWISVTLLTALSGCALFLINREVSFGEIVMFTAIFLLALFASFYVSLCHRPVASWEMLEALVVQPLDQTGADGSNARVAAVDLSTESVRSHGVRNDPTAEHQVSQEDLVMNSILHVPSPPGAIASVASVGPPPPPYHIAILLPEQTSGIAVSRIIDESPPPSYEKAVS